MADRIDFPAGSDDTVFHSTFDTQPSNAKSVSGTLDSPTDGADVKTSAMSTSLGAPDNSQGSFPTGGKLDSPVED